MTDRDSLLTAIHADPESDLPRLVYADWLEENDDPGRAEFVRLQSRLDRLRVGANLWWPDGGGGRACDEMSRLTDREEELLRARRRDWLAALPRPPAGVDYEFSRGLPEVLHAQPGATNRTVEAAAAAAPSVTSLILEGALIWYPQTLGGFLASLKLPRLTRLGLAGTFPNGDALMSLAASPAVESLTCLTVGTTSGAGLDSLRALFGSPHLGRLTDLSLHGVPLGRDGMGLLIGSSLIGRLRRLDLSETHLTADAVADLAATPAAAGLTHLCLHNNEVTDAGVQALAASPHMGGLTHLGLNSAGLSSAAAAALAGSESLARLTHLDLGSNRLGRQGAALLAGGHRLAGVRSLGLADNDLGKAGAAPLSGSALASGLTRLDLGSNRVGRDGVRAAVAAATELEVLLLPDNGCGPPGAAELTEARLPGLRHLDLSHTGIGDAGLRSLAASGPTGLTALAAAGCGVTARGAKALAGAARLAGLARLDLSGNSIGEAGQREVITSKVLAGLRRLDLSANQSLKDAVATSLRRSAGRRRLLELHL